MIEPNVLGKIIGDLIDKNRENVETKNGDYINPDDGLLYCGKCGEPKEGYVNVADFMVRNGYDKQIKMWHPCKCDRERQEEEKRQKREYEKSFYIRELRKNSLMDDQFTDKTFETFKTDANNAKAFKVCKRYVEHFDEMFEKNQGLIFYGGVGTGKSFMAACIANSLLDKAYPVIMTSLVKLLENSQGFKGIEEAMINHLCNVKLLVLDDLGAERSTDFALEKVYDIIDSRYRVKKPMIITTNIELSAMKSPQDVRYSRLYDRILEICYPVKFEGFSRRKNEARRRYEEMKKLLEGDD